MVFHHLHGLLGRLVDLLRRQADPPGDLVSRQWFAVDPVKVLEYGPSPIRQLREREADDGDVPGTGAIRWRASEEITGWPIGSGLVLVGVF